MADPDFGRIKRNISKMIDLGAPESDIDAYVAQEGVTVDQLRSASAPTKLESAGRGAVQGASLGFGDELSGIRAAATAGLPEGVRAGPIGGLIGGGARLLAEKVAPSIFGNSASDAYTARRDEVRAQNEAAQKENPWSYGGGQVAGSVATAFIPGTQIAKGASLANQVRQGATIGAGFGALQGAGEANELKDVPGAALVGAGLGGAIGGSAPMLARGLSRVVSPLPVSAERSAAAQRLADEGIELTAGQKTGSKGLRWLESTLGDMPLAGAKAAKAQERQGEQFTQAVLRRAGSDAPRATQETIDEAFKRVGGVFDDVAKRNTLQMDVKFSEDIGKAVEEYVGLVPSNDRAPIFLNTIRDIVKEAENGGKIGGELYQSWRSRLDKAARASLRGAKSDPQLADALWGIKNALDSALERSASPADALALKAARRQYGSLIPIAKASTGAGEAIGEGILSPAAMRAQVKSQNAMNFARGRGDLAGLVKDAQALMTPLPNSGTAPRQNIQNMLTSLAPGVIAGSAAGLPGAIAGLLAPPVAGRVLFSRPVQAYLGNQAAAQSSPMLGLLAAAPLRELSIEQARQRGLLNAR